LKIIVYSDLHLEFGTDFKPPKDSDCDLMILAGDIIVLKDFEPLDRFLEGWKKPVLYVPGNHEYYSRRPMPEDEAAFRAWLSAHHPYVTLLLNEEITFQGVNFFGGTMWTNFADADPIAMIVARQNISDFRLIRTTDGELLKPIDTVAFHQDFVGKLINWFEKPLTGPRVVISHHAPVINPHTQYRGSNLIPAFNSSDMPAIIEQYQPQLWVYGHTHECDRQTIGKTLIISNQLGYPKPDDRYECEGFDKGGLQIVV
jgi:predicted phosphodiesterase